MRILRGFCPVTEQAAVLSPDIPKGLADISPNAHSQTDERTSPKNAGAFHLRKACFPLCRLPWPCSEFSSTLSLFPTGKHTFRRASACVGWDRPTVLKLLRTKMCSTQHLPHLCRKTPTKFTLKCPEHSMWAFPSSQLQNISD